MHALGALILEHNKYSILYYSNAVNNSFVFKNLQRDDSWSWL
jgi:hypothetical protein